MKIRATSVMLVSVAMLVAALVLAACSTRSTPSESRTSATDAKPYGSLTVQVAFATGGALDPQVSQQAGFHVLGAAIFDSLVELTPDAQLTPGLAERWEIAPDGNTHTFYIRKGVKFHDGSDLTGADVKFSLERTLAPDSTQNDKAIWRDAIARVDLKDDYTVVLQMKSPQFELLKGFGDYSGSSAVVPKKYIEEKGIEYFRRNPVGSGPWKVLSYELGNRVELEAVDSHWRAVPKFKNITLLSVPEEGARVAMLKTGELDIAAVAPDSALGLKSAGLRTISYKGGSQYIVFLFYDMDHPAQYSLGDVRVRKALSLAVNRQEMAGQIGGGYAEPLAVYHVPTTGYFFDPNVLKPDPYDPDGAKKMLSEAGYPSGFDLKLWNAGVGSEGILNQALTGYWRKIGVNAEIIARDTGIITSMYNPKLVPAIYNTAVGKVSAAGAFAFEKMTAYHSTKTTIHNIKNTRLDELIDLVPQTLEPVAKKKLALEAALLAKNEYVDLAVLSLHTIFVFGSKVGGMTPIQGMTGLAPSFETVTHSK